MRNSSTARNATGRPLVAGSRLRGDRGAALAEAALVTPVFVVFMFGLLEFGGLFRDYLAVNNAASAGGRIASIAGNSPTTDSQIRDTIAKEIKAMPLWQVQRIVVFHAATPTDTVPAACLSGNIGTSGSGAPNYTGACNVYTTSPNWQTLSGTDFGCGASSADQYWCPSVRKVAALAALGNGPPDFVGIYIQVTHAFYTGLFGSNMTLTKTSVYRIEPQVLK